MGLFGTTFRVSRRLHRILERMGRGRWVLLGQHVVCPGGCILERMGRGRWVLLEKPFVWEPTGAVCHRRRAITGDGKARGKTGWEPTGAVYHRRRAVTYEGAAGAGGGKGGGGKTGWVPTGAVYHRRRAYMKGQQERGTESCRAKRDGSRLVRSITAVVQ